MNDTITENNNEVAPQRKLSKQETDAMAVNIVKAIKTVQDPEIPVDIFELGLIYDMYINDDKDVFIKMTLTAPGCPVAGEMVGWVEKAVREVKDVRKADVELVFDPPWDMSRMSDEARVQLNLI